jgi:hypothetical protein
MEKTLTFSFEMYFKTSFLRLDFHIHRARKLTILGLNFELFSLVHFQIKR